MKRINQQIKKLIIEIFLITGVIITTGMYWKNLDLSALDTYAANSHNINTLEIKETEKIAENLLYPISDSNAVKNLKPGKFIVENYINQEKEYNLIIKINKSSSLDYNFITIKIDYEVFKLKDANILEDEQYCYLIIGNYTVLDKNEHQIIIWLNEETTNEAMDKILNYSIEVQDTSTLLAMK